MDIGKDLQRAYDDGYAQAIVDIKLAHKPITNADRIRSMTDEELAELWWERVDCGECPVHKDCRMTGQDCKKLALDWLRQEASDG